MTITFDNSKCLLSVLSGQGGLGSTTIQGSGHSKRALKWQHCSESSHSEKVDFCLL